MKFDWATFILAMILFGVAGSLIGIEFQSAKLGIAVLLIGEGFIFGIRAAIGKK